MGMKFWRLGERWRELDQSLASSFTKVRGDIAVSFSWLNYLREKDKIHDSRNERNSYFLGKMSAEIRELQREIQILKGQVAKGHARTLERTSQGQVRDVSQPKVIEKKDISPPKPTTIGTSGLRASQLEVLNVLYESDRPLGYNEIARRLGKSEKSIRNMIYELRVAGIGVLDKPIGSREKGFYLDAETKITVSGR